MPATERRQHSMQLSGVLLCIIIEEIYVIGQIGKGMLILLGVKVGDTVTIELTSGT